MSSEEFEIQEFEDSEDEHSEEQVCCNGVEIVDGQELDFLDGLSELASLQSGEDLQKNKQSMNLL